MPETYAKGDRVVVMDLRTGTSYPSVVVKGSMPNSRYINVQYDGSRSIHRVGVGFVKKES